MKTVLLKVRKLKSLQKLASIASNCTRTPPCSCMQDKHAHAYQIVALSDTAINLKGEQLSHCRLNSTHMLHAAQDQAADQLDWMHTALSTRLGLGKAPLQPVPESALPALLRSPEYVTFTGLADAASQQVVSLLDARAAAEPALSVQAPDGSGDVIMSGADIDKFLRYSAASPRANEHRHRLDICATDSIS